MALPLPCLALALLPTNERGPHHFHLASHALSPHSQRARFDGGSFARGFCVEFCVGFCVGFAWGFGLRGFFWGGGETWGWPRVVGSQDRCSRVRLDGHYYHYFKPVRHCTCTRGFKTISRSWRKHSELEEKRSKQGLHRRRLSSTRLQPNALLMTPALIPYGCSFQKALDAR